MQETHFLVRQPVLDSAQRVVGYELGWHESSTGGMASDEDLQGLVEILVERLTHQENGWLLAESMLFLEATPALVASEEIQALPPKTTTLTLTLADLADTDTMTAVQALRKQGFGILLRDANLLTVDRAILPHVSHVEVRMNGPEFATQSRFCAQLKQVGIHMVARQVTTWRDYDECADLGLDAFLGNLYLTPREGLQPKGLNPAQAIILQLMEMVRQNADIRQLEGALKRDAALSYKLFRYINSVGFGLGAEIQSLRHAVTMLGYSPLYRWLSLLLASASDSGSAVLLQTAIVRGRFAELLGHGILPKNEAENLFVAGMFSLLDRLLGVPMEQVLENIQLSDAVSQALLSREGMYGPFLALAEACESNTGDVQGRADALFINARQVNEAHLAALAWAQAIKLS